MVKITLGLLFFVLPIFSEPCEGQTVTAPAEIEAIEAQHDLLDPSLISNQIFLFTPEETLGQELQFNVDELERLKLLPALSSKPTWAQLQNIPTLTDLDIFRILNNKTDSADPFSARLRTVYTPFHNPSSRSASHFLLRTNVTEDPNASAEANYQSGYYHGSPLKVVSRLAAKSEDLLFSLVQAKAPGEPLLFDQLTGCVATMHSFPIFDSLFLRTCVLGDYSLSFGNGLLFSNGPKILSSKEVNLNPATHSTGIQPYISSSAFRYFQGVASEASYGMFSLSGFYSDREIDATIDTSTNTITSLSSTGYHRTTSEIARRNQARSFVSGVHISITPLATESFLQFGTTAYTLNYDRPIVSTNSFGFNGQRHGMFSVDTRAAFSILSWSGEYARMISDAGRADASAFTILADPISFWELSLNYRDLPSTFISPFGSTFGINASAATNEQGFYIGSKFTLLPNRWWVFASTNVAQNENSAAGLLHYSDVLLGSKYNLTGFPLHLALQARSYSKGRAFSQTGDSLGKTSIRFDATSALSTSMSIAFLSQWQRSYSTADSVFKGGYLVGISIYYLPMSTFSVSSGIAYFETDSYASRFYSNEDDISGSVPFVALYGVGNRFYLQLSYDVVRALTLTARIAQTSLRLSPAASINHSTTVGAQCEIAF